MQELINPSPSSFGSSFHAALLQCMQLASYKYNMTALDADDELTVSPALQKGKLIHVGLAHYYATLPGVQVVHEGKVLDASNTLPVHEALRIAAYEQGALDYLDLAIAALDGYRAEYAIDDLQPIAVEHVLSAELEGYAYGHRIDLIAEDKYGRVWLIDHKTGSPDARTLEAFALDMAFLGDVLLGQAHYGNRFGGVLVNAIGIGRVPFTYSRHRPAFAPWALSQLPKELIRVRREWDALHEAGVDPWEYPKRLHNLSCMTRYGSCPAAHLCKMGPTVLGKKT